MTSARANWHMVELYVEMTEINTEHVPLHDSIVHVVAGDNHENPQNVQNDVQTNVEEGAFIQKRQIVKAIPVTRRMRRPLMEI